MQRKHQGDEYESLYGKKIVDQLGMLLALLICSHASVGAEELRIGFLAPTTGIFAQVGKDMVDGFQMYLDEVKSDFAGAQVKFIVEDEQGKPDTGVTKVKKSGSAGQGADVRRRAVGVDRLCARPLEHQRFDLHRPGRSIG